MGSKEEHRAQAAAQAQASALSTMRFLRLAMAALPLAFAAAKTQDATKLCFPDKFMFGSATASYQVEGGWNEGNRTTSIWDDFCRSHPKISCANVADDFYHRYVSDIQMIKEAGHQTFRLSVSWSRAMNWDNSTKHMKPNPIGLTFYHAVIDELLKSGITPILTIYHWDLPSELHTQLSPAGWLNGDIHEHFVEFSTLLFNEFGTKVNYWATFNEPFIFIRFGYGATPAVAHAPGLGGNDTIQYIAAHNVLLSHGKAVQKFRELKDKKVIGANARIGLVVPGEHTLPVDPTKPEDVEAADRVQQFWMGWFMDPIVKGDYPEVMKKRVGDRLPKFTANESALLKGSYDLFMLNHYSSHTATPCNSSRSTVSCDAATIGWTRDLGVDTSGKPSGFRNASVDRDNAPINPNFSAYPPGYRELIKWIHALNTSTDILLTENGFCGNESIEGLDRLWYHQSYLEQVHKAITEDKIPVIGYTAWSLMDNYEWGSYKPRYGIYYVNFTGQIETGNDTWVPKASDLARVPRKAATWFSDVAKTKCMEPWQEPKADAASGSSGFHVASTASVVAAIALAMVAA